MSAAPFDAVSLLGQAVQDVADDLPALIAASTAPDLADLAAPYAALSEAAGRLRTVMDELGDAIAREMTGDQVAGERFRIDRRRTQDRKQWDQTSLRRDYVRHLQRKAGVLDATVLSADGELLDITVGALMAEALNLYGSVAPKVTSIRAVGMDPQDYAEVSKGRTQITVTPLADVTTNESGDAA